MFNFNAIKQPLNIIRIENKLVRCGHSLLCHNYETTHFNILTHFVIVRLSIKL